MSCGNPHAVDCRKVLEKVYYYLDGELPDDHEKAEIREHLDECAPCLRAYGVEQEVKALVARSCGRDHAPDGLRERLLLKLREVRVEITHVEYRAE